MKISCEVSYFYYRLAKKTWQKICCPIVRLKMTEILKLNDKVRVK